MKLLYVIPSYEPTDKLAGVVAGLMAALDKPSILVVDDGSGEAFRHCFDAVEAMGAVVVRHGVNLGKGRGLKTAFNWFLNHTPEYDGVLTLDSDGQHKIPDVLLCAEAFAKNPKAMILGSRDFDAPGVPFKSRSGNKLTRTVLRYLCGIRLSDTQTGLRVIPAAFIPALMRLAGERFEYETNMLLEAKTANVPLAEVKISTVYEDGNSGSHFNPLRDSLMIYATFLRFILSALSSAGIDLLLYSLFIMLLAGMTPHYIIVSAYAARIFSSLFNFTVNRHFVFKGYGHSALVKYYILATCQLLVSGYGTAWLFGYNSMLFNEVTAKILVDVVLFLCSYGIQRVFIFRNDRR